eukprot:3936580-Pyramimonas_sp.AAC.1
MRSKWPCTIGARSPRTCFHASPGARSCHGRLASCRLALVMFGPHHPPLMAGYGPTRCATREPRRCRNHV